MLTILHPYLMPMIQQIPGGIWLLNLPSSERATLIVKAPKEYILAAKINGGFKVYLTPVEVDGNSTCGLITAFFDDADEPLTLRTPLFDDDFSHQLIAGLVGSEVDVHFFDELSRERLVYAATLSRPWGNCVCLLLQCRARGHSLTG